MAAIDFPFAASATRRRPTTDELANGYGCGPAQLDLFNWLAWYFSGQVNGVIEGAGLNPDDADLNQLLKAIRSQGMNYRAASGAANSLTITLAPAVTDWAELVNVPLLVKATAANTSATVTLSPNGLATKPIKRLGGAALNAGDLQADFFYEMVYDGTQMQIVSTIAPPASASTTKAPKLVGISAIEAAANSLAVSTPTLLTLGTTVQNNLGTSTWSGTTLTVGAGEAGLWFVGAGMSLINGSGGSYNGVMIYQNGVQVAMGSNSAGLSGDGSQPSVPAILKLAVGDTVRMYGYTQSGGVSTSGNANTRFAAYLISAY